MKIAVWFEETDSNRNLFGFLLGLLGQKYCLDVRQDTSSSNGDSTEKFVQLLVVSDSQLQVPWDDPGLLVVTGSIASQLEDLSAQVLEHSSQVDWCTSANSLSIVSFLQVSVDTSNWELKSSPEWSGLGLSLGFASFSASRHVDYSVLSKLRKFTTKFCILRFIFLARSGRQKIGSISTNQIAAQTMGRIKEPIRARLAKKDQFWADFFHIKAFSS